MVWTMNSVDDELVLVPELRSMRLLQSQQERNDERLQVCCPKHMPANACGGCSLNVTPLVANQYASADVDRMPLYQFVDHAGLRLSANTCLPILRDGTLRMVRTVSELIDARANTCQLAGHPCVKPSNLLFSIQTPRNTRLVCHHKGNIAGSIDGSDGFHRALDPSNLARLESVAIVLVEDAVTIEEYCRAALKSLYSLDQLVLRSISANLNWKIARLGFRLRQTSCPELR